MSKFFVPLERSSVSVDRRDASARFKSVLSGMTVRQRLLFMVRYAHLHHAKKKVRRAAHRERKSRERAAARVAKTSVMPPPFSL